MTPPGPTRAARSTARRLGPLAVPLAALLAAACAGEFTTDPRTAPRLEARPGWRDTLSVTDTAELELRLVDATLGALEAGRATWTSSDDRVLRVEPLPTATGDAGRDTLAARRTRVRVVAGGPGAVTLTVRTDATAGLEAAARDFPLVVRPLRYVPVRWRAALSAGESDTLQVEVRDVRGAVLTDRLLRWQSSDETRLRLVPIPATGTAADPAAERRLKVRAVALADGPVSVSVGLDPSVAAEGSDTTLAIGVAPLALVRSRGRDTLSVTDVDTLQVRLTTSIADSIGLARFDWTTSDPAVLALAQPAPAGDPAADSLAARQARMRATARAPGTVTVTARSRPAAGEPAVERTWTVAVLPLRLERVSGPDTVSVDDATPYAVRVVNARGDPVPGATVEWRSSADSVLAGAAAAVSGAPGVWQVVTQARRRGDVVLTAVGSGLGGVQVADPLEIPVRVMERWVHVVAGETFACGLTSAGAAYCWGADPPNIDALAIRTRPTRVMALYSEAPPRFRKLRAGRRHACGEGFDTPGLWACWGDGILGTGDSITVQRFAVRMTQGRVALTELAIDRFRNCGIAPEFRADVLSGGRSDGMIVCWGGGGTLPLLPSAGRFVRVPGCSIGQYEPQPACGNNSELFDARELAVSDGHWCAVTGRLTACGGRNVEGQLGNPAPGTVPVSAVGVVGSDRTPLHGVAVNDYQSCALGSGGEAYCWGLGYGRTMRRVLDGYRFGSLVGKQDRITLSAAVSPAAPGPPPEWVSLDSYGDLAMCGVTVDGQGLCWRDATSAPTPIPGALRVRTLAPAWTHACALTTPDGAIYCWGSLRYAGAGSGVPPGAPPWRILEPEGSR